MRNNFVEALLASVLQTLAARGPLKSRRLWIVRYGSSLHRNKYTQQFAFGLRGASIPLLRGGRPTHL